MKNDGEARLVFPCLVRYLYSQENDDDDDKDDNEEKGTNANEELSDNCADQVLAAGNICLISNISA
jgi:hypothetical protein